MALALTLGIVVAAFVFMTVDWLGKLLMRDWILAFFIALTTSLMVLELVRAEAQKWLASRS